MKSCPSENPIKPETVAQSLQKNIGSASLSCPIDLNQLASPAVLAQRVWTPHKAGSEPC